MTQQPENGEGATAVNTLGQSCVTLLLPSTMPVLSPELAGMDLSHRQSLGYHHSSMVATETPGRRPQSVPKGSRLPLTLYTSKEEHVCEIQNQTPSWPMWSSFILLGRNCFYCLAYEQHPSIESSSGTGSPCACVISRCSHAQNSRRDQKYTYQVDKNLLVFSCVFPEGPKSVTDNRTVAIQGNCHFWLFFDGCLTGKQLHL